VEGTDNAVIFKSDSQQLKSHFIHQVTNETLCSESNGERQPKQPDCLMYLLMPAPCPSAANSKPHTLAHYVVILLLEWHEQTGICSGKWLRCRSDLLPSPSKSLILKKYPAPLWLLL